MKYKTGDKFIIEIDKELATGLYRVKGFNTLVFDDYGLDMLEQVHEHDGCDGCKYEWTKADVYPCNACKQNMVDHWTPKPEIIQESKLESDPISRQAAIEAIEKAYCNPCKERGDDHNEVRCRACNFDDAINQIDSLPPVEDMGEVSDGYHTFNQLYHQRAVLFATIVNQNKDKAWKSWKHEDGQFCFDKGGEWFIVGIDTPEGSYTYHYEQKYWDMFDCEELERGKHWDGHTEDDVTRLLSFPPVEPKRPQGVWVDFDLKPAPNGVPVEKCGNCGEWSTQMNKNFCPNCGADMRGDKG